VIHTWLGISAWLVGSLRNDVVLPAVVAKCCFFEEFHELLLLLTGLIILFLMFRYK